MSAIKVKRILQTQVESVTQPLTIGGLAEDGSDAILTVNNGGVTGLSKSYPFTIPSASWSGASAPFTKTIVATGIRSTDEPHIRVNMPANYATGLTMRENLAKIYDADSGTDSLTFYADEVPTADIDILVTVVR